MNERGENMYIPMDKGNIITKYWFKKYMWYDFRFLGSLPLFSVYLIILSVIFFTIIGFQISILGLEYITRIELKDLFHNIHLR